MRLRNLALALLLTLAIPGVAFAQEASAPNASDACYCFYQDEDGNLVQMDVDPSETVPLGAYAYSEALGDSYPSPTCAST